MGKRISIIVLALILGFTLGAYAEVQNVKVGGDIIVRGVSRENFSLRDSVANTDDSSAILTGIRLRVDADLTDNVSATLRLINEREWDSESDSNSDIDLDLGYVTLKEFLYSPLSLTMGRQEIRLGNGLVVGDPDTNLTAATGYNSAFRDLSSRKGFDAIRASLNYDPLIVDLIMAKIDENVVALNDDTNLYGINLRYTLGNLWKLQNSLLEAYYLEKRVGSNASGVTQVNKSTGNWGGTATRNDKSAKTRVLGARISTNPTEKLNLQLEGAYQFGRYDPALDVNAESNAITGKRRAYAAQAIANYLLGDKYNTQLLGSYTFLSGEKDTRVSGTYHGWDPMYEDQTPADIINAIMGFTNSHTFTLSASTKPMEDITVNLSWARVLLDKVYREGNYISLGTTSTYLMTNKKHLGDEIDLKLTYDYTEDVQFGLSAGVFLPGKAFNKVNREDASQIIGSMKVTF